MRLFLLLLLAGPAFAVTVRDIPRQNDPKEYYAVPDRNKYDHLKAQLRLVQADGDLTPQMKRQLAALHDRATMTYLTSDRTEFSFTVDAGGNPGPIHSSHTAMHDYIVVHTGDTAIVHTHPSGASVQPSDDDVAVAKHGEFVLR